MPDEKTEGRSLFDVPTIAMLGGLTLGYGAFALIAGRFLYPARATPRRWMFVARVARLKDGQAILFRTPTGATVNIARRGNAGTADDFIALSSVCPHLGCQVHWEGHKNRFFCPCHNGVFTPEGVATEGPPGDAGQSLPRYPLKVDKGLLFIEVPVGGIADAGVIERPEGPSGPGHDPCLAERPPRRVC